MTEQAKDAFDTWWQWAEKPADSMLTIPGELHEAVMALSPEERRDRAKVNAAAKRAAPVETALAKRARVYSASL
jgi:hypothetical protein